MLSGKQSADAVALALGAGSHFFSTAAAAASGVDQCHIMTSM